MSSGTADAPGTFPTRWAEGGVGSLLDISPKLVYSYPHEIVNQKVEALRLNLGGNHAQRNRCY